MIEQPDEKIFLQFEAHMVTMIIPASKVTTILIDHRINMSVKRS